MVYRYFFLILLLCIELQCIGESHVIPTITIDAAPATEKAKLMALAINPDDELALLSARISNNLRCTNQRLTGFNVTEQTLPSTPNKQAMKEFFAQGFSLVFIVNKVAQDVIEWRIYDPSTLTMYEGKRYKLTGSLKKIADFLTDAVWKILTGQDGIFCTKIAFCKERAIGIKRNKELCVTTLQENTTHIPILQGKILAPRWHSDPKRHLLFYSEITPRNVRLMTIDGHGTQHIVSNFDGLNMLPAFDSKNTIMAYCLSKDGQTSIYCFNQHTKDLERLLLPRGNNISPSFSDSDNIFFCSDATGTPKIYYYRAADKTVETVTPEGYCTAPTWCQKIKTLAYCKLIKGIMQIVFYDYSTKQHTQVTFSAGNKDECCWSPCGNYLAFSCQNRIAIFNVTTHEQFFITNPTDVCSYPAWSPSHMPQPRKRSSG